MPKVSIIVPCYNTAPYLDECMQSIVNQTLSDIEIICVDDGSTDKTGKMLDNYAAKDSRIKVIHKENGGYGKAMNVGLDNASGEYIGIVEPDDYVALGMYETLYNKAIINNVNIVKADYCRFIGNIENRKIILYEKIKNPDYYNKIIDIKNDITPFTFPMNTWNGIYEREFIEKYHIRHNETPGASFQDNGFWFQTYALADSIYYIDSVFYHNRRDNINSSVKNPNKVYCIVEEYKFIREFVNKYNLYERLIHYYTYKKFANYLWNFNRIDIKFKREFLKLFAKELKIANKNRELIYNWCNEKEYVAFKTILKNPQKFYRKSLNKQSFFGAIFSIKNQLSKNNKWYKVIYILGLKFSFRNKRKEKRMKKYELYGKVDYLVNENRNLKNQINNINRNLRYKLHKYCAPEMRPVALKDWYYECTGEVLNLENPKTFNEKIQWLKLYDSTPIKTRLADKYLVREWVKEKIGEEYLIPLLGVWDSFDEIDFDELPNQFVLKCNHGSGYNIIVKDKSKLNIEDAKRKINTWINEDFAFRCGFEMHYSAIPRKIIAEKYIAELGQNGIFDYRFFCFNGKCEQIWLDIDSGTPQHKRKIYDKNWNELDIIVKWPRLEQYIEKPKDLDKLIIFAEDMAKDFSLARVDFYIINSKIYFGEMTFTSMSGIGKFEPKSEDLRLGQMIKLPIEQKEKLEV